MKAEAILESLKGAEYHVAEIKKGERSKQAPLPFTTSTLQQEDSKLLLIDSCRITQSCSNACGFHQQLIRNLLQIVSEKNLRFHHKLEITAKRTTREKLMSYLMAQAKQAGSDSFTIPYDRQELADFLQVERSAMSAEISKLRADGVLESKRNYFRIL